MKKFMSGLNMEYNKFVSLVKNSKFLIWYVKFYKKNSMLMSMLQVLMLLLMYYNFDEFLNTGSLLSVMMLTMLLLLVKFFYIGMLNYFDWNKHVGSPWPKESLEKLFKKHKMVNGFLMLVLKYFHIYSLFLMLSGMVALLLSYISYMFVKMNLFYFWMKVDKIIAFMGNFMYEYMWMLTDEVYLKFKKEFLKMGYKEFMTGSMKMMFMMCMTQGLMKFLYMMLMMKLMKLVNSKLVEWADDLESWEDNALNDLNSHLLWNANMLQHLNFSKKEEYMGYMKMMPVFDKYTWSSDELYKKNEKLSCYDMYSGLSMNDLCDLNFVMQTLLLNSYLVECCVKKEEFKENRKLLKELKSLLKKQFKLMKEMMYYLEENNMSLKPKMHMDGYTFEPKLYFEMEVGKKYVEKMKKNKKEMSMMEKMKKMQTLEDETYNLWKSEDKDTKLSSEFYFQCYVASFRPYFEYSEEYESFCKDLTEKYMSKMFMPELVEEKDMEKFSYK